MSVMLRAVLFGSFDFYFWNFYPIRNWFQQVSKTICDKYHIMWHYSFSRKKQLLFLFALSSAFYNRTLHALLPLCSALVRWRCHVTPVSRAVIRIIIKPRSTWSLLVFTLASAFSHMINQLLLRWFEECSNLFTHIILHPFNQILPVKIITITSGVKMFITKRAHCQQKKVDCRKETNWRRKFLCADDRRGRVSSSLLRARYDRNIDIGFRFFIIVL